jgi:hypothetical protein
MLKQTSMDGTWQFKDALTFSACSWRVSVVDALCIRLVSHWQRLEHPDTTFAKAVGTVKTAVHKVEIPNKTAKEGSFGVLTYFYTGGGVGEDYLCGLVIRFFSTFGYTVVQRGSYAAHFSARSFMILEHCSLHK